MRWSEKDMSARLYSDNSLMLPVDVISDMTQFVNHIFDVTNDTI